MTISYTMPPLDVRVYLQSVYTQAIHAQTRLHMNKLTRKPKRICFSFQTTFMCSCFGNPGKKNAGLLWARTVHQGKQQYRRPLLFILLYEPTWSATCINSRHQTESGLSSAWGKVTCVSHTNRPYRPREADEKHKYLNRMVICAVNCEAEGCLLWLKKSLPSCEPSNGHLTLADRGKGTERRERTMALDDQAVLAKFVYL